MKFVEDHQETFGCHLLLAQSAQIFPGLSLCGDGSAGSMDRQLQERRGVSAVQGGNGSGETRQLLQNTQSVLPTTLLQSEQ